MNKHTPGPWRIAADEPRKVVSDSIDGLDPLTGENLVGGASVGPYAEANARLTAAAPDLLAALRKSAEGWANAIELGLIPPQHRTAAEVLRDEAFATIAKAEGRS